LVEETARTADIELRRVWLDLTIAPALSGLSLLALGAPADLVEACNQALVDETAHARL
jgi:hypothetical protein